MTLRLKNWIAPAFGPRQAGQEDRRAWHHCRTAILRWSLNAVVDDQRIHRSIRRERDGVTRTQAANSVKKADTEARESRLSLPKGGKIAPRLTRIAEALLP